MKSMDEKYDYLPEKAEMKEFVLESTYKNFPYPVRWHIAPDSQKICFFAHGLYDHMDGHNNFYTMLFKKLADKNITSAVQLTTARDSHYYEIGYIPEAFEDKTFEEEFSDVHQSIEHGFSCSETFTKTTAPPHGICMGLSLGGSIMAINAHLFPQVKTLILLSAGIKEHRPDLPIVSSYPPKEDMQAYASAFQGNLIHICPENDSIVSRAEQEALFSAFTNVRQKEFLIIKNADHAFNGQKEEIEKVVTEVLQKISN